VRIVSARLIRPRVKADVLVGVLLPTAGRRDHSSKPPVPPHDSVTASLSFLVRSVLARQGNPIRVTIGITDQFGTEYQLKTILVRTIDPTLPKVPLTTNLISGLRSLPGLRPATQPEP